VDGSTQLNKEPGKDSINNNVTQFLFTTGLISVYPC